MWTTCYQYARSSTSLLSLVGVGLGVSETLLNPKTDYHHDWIFPSSTSAIELMPRILATWKRGIKPKQHLSEPRFGAVSIMVNFSKSL